MSPRNGHTLIVAIPCCMSGCANQKEARQRTMNRFKKFGATSKKRIYGYVVPHGIKTFDGWLKDPDAERHIHEGVRVLPATLNGEAVADNFRRR